MREILRLLILQRREDKMKQQFRFLIAGLSLTGLLVYTATPASAQVTSATFSVAIVSLSIDVTPNAVPLGDLSLGQVVNSVPNTEIVITNTSRSIVELFVAGTNSKDSSLNPSWTLVDTAVDQEKFKFGYRETGTENNFIFLAGPTSDPAHPNFGDHKSIGRVAPTAAKRLEWEFHAPNSTIRTEPQEFNLSAAAALSNGGQMAVLTAFRNGMQTGTPTSGATGPVPLP